jgi:C-8 sterol isomerase
LPIEIYGTILKCSVSLFTMAPTSSAGGIGRFLMNLAIVMGMLTPVIYMLEKNLESFYIFQPEHLHDLAKRGIAAHGNDTRGIVNYIVSELNEKVPRHINLDEDWVFNNAGGAMGAMYIIHASKFISFLSRLR